MNGRFAQSISDPYYEILLLENNSVCCISNFLEIIIIYVVMPQKEAHNNVTLY